MENLGTHWRKSSYSGNGGSDCVEVANAVRTVAVRDSKDVEGPQLAIHATQWRAFLGRVQQDR